MKQYPEHEFVIDFDEAIKIGLKVEKLPSALDALFDALIPKLNEGLALLGQFKEIKHETQDLPTESETDPTDEKPRERGEDRHSVVEGE